MENILKELTSNMDIADPKAKQQIVDAIMAAENEDILIGLDISDVLNLFRDYTDLHIGMINAGNNTDATKTIDALIASTQADVSGCNKVYLYIKGDVSLMDVNDVAQALENRLGDEVEILFTATYDANKADEYDVLAFFIQ